MANMRGELSKKNKYYIPKNRYYELKYFCLQYPQWKKRQAEIDGLARRSNSNGKKQLEYVDSTYTGVAVRSYYTDNIRMLENATKLSDPVLSEYILLGVTRGLSYNTLRMQYMIPCGRDMYYDRYRRFFWILDILKHKYAGDRIQ